MNTRVSHALALHGGAGDYRNAGFSQDKIDTYHKSLYEAAQLGQAVLKDGGSAIEAIEEAVRVLEDNPLFNAGRGSVFTDEGNVELDAAIMDGNGLHAGAAAGVRTTRHAISLARAIMEKSEHVMLHGRGADAFGAGLGMQQVDNSFFHTDFRRAQWEEARKTGKPVTLGKFGTVGAVALDQHGNIAAGTSTGGLTNKQFGRVGDSPIIGAGTYASNAGCAVSCTGHGEYFIRATLARDVSALMEMAGLSLEAASTLMIEDRLHAMGGEGGLVGVDRLGNLSLVFNTSGMFRAFAIEDRAITTGVFKDDERTH
jgi:beta-aspartyl-peptidase (threonine type)